MKKVKEDKLETALRQRFPDWSEEEMGMAKDKIRRYVQLAIEVYEEAMADPERRRELEAFLAKREAEELNN